MKTSVGLSCAATLVAALYCGGASAADVVSVLVSERMADFQIELTGNKPADFKPEGNPLPSVFYYDATGKLRWGEKIATPESRWPEALQSAAADVRQAPSAAMTFPPTIEEALEIIRNGNASIEGSLELTKGRPVLVWFGATMCPPCTAQAATVSKAADTLGEDAVLLKVSLNYGP